MTIYYPDVDADAGDDGSRLRIVEVYAPTVDDLLERHGEEFLELLLSRKLNRWERETLDRDHQRVSGFQIRVMWDEERAIMGDTIQVTGAILSTQDLPGALTTMVESLWLAGQEKHQLIGDAVASLESRAAAVNAALDPPGQTGQ